MSSRQRQIPRALDVPLSNAVCHPVDSKVTCDRWVDRNAVFLMEHQLRGLGAASRDASDVAYGTLPSPHITHRAARFSTSVSGPRGGGLTAQKPSSSTSMGDLAI